MVEDKLEILIINLDLYGFYLLYKVLIQYLFLNLKLFVVIR